MVLTDPQGNRVLVQTEGHINLVIEPERGKASIWSRLRPILPVMGATVVVSSLVSSSCAVAIALQIRDSAEVRLVSRIEQLGDHLDAVAASLGTHVEQQSERVSQEVVRVGEHVDLIPAKLDAAAQGTSNAVIAWLSSLKKAQPPVPLVIRAVEGKRK